MIKKTQPEEGILKLANLSFVVLPFASGTRHTCLEAFWTHIVQLTRRVGQSHIYTVHLRCFWQENHQNYGHIQCIHTVLANSTCGHDSHDSPVLVFDSFPHILIDCLLYGHLGIQSENVAEDVTITCGWWRQCIVLHTDYNVVDEGRALFCISIIMWLMKAVRCCAYRLQCGWWRPCIVLHIDYNVVDEGRALFCISITMWLMKAVHCFAYRLQCGWWRPCIVLHIDYNVVDEGRALFCISITMWLMKAVHCFAYRLQCGWWRPCIVLHIDYNVVDEGRALFCISIIMWLMKAVRCFAYRLQCGWWRPCIVLHQIQYLNLYPRYVCDS